MNITQDFLGISAYNRPGTKLGKVTAVACHYVGNPKSTAINNRNYFNNLSKTKTAKASSHYIIGLEGEIIQCIPEDEYSYCTNQANGYTISIETCHPDSSGKYNVATYQSFVELCADICKRYKLDPMNGGLIRHYDVSKKCCPKWFVDNPAAWEQFKKDVKTVISNVSINISPSVIPVKTSNPYLVPTGNIKSGSRGDNVKWAQWYLKDKGYDIGSTGIDGVFGKKTDAATRSFQKTKGLVVDGIIGPKTRAALEV